MRKITKDHLEDTMTDYKTIDLFWKNNPDGQTGTRSDLPGFIWDVAREEGNSQLVVTRTVPDGRTFPVGQAVSIAMATMMAEADAAEAKAHRTDRCLEDAQVAASEFVSAFVEYVSEKHGQKLTRADMIHVTRALSAGDVQAAQIMIDILNDALGIHADEM